MFLLATQPKVSTIPGSFTTDVIVPTNDSAVVDSIDLSLLHSAKWIVTITGVGGYCRLFEVSVVHGFNNTIFKNMFGNIGDNIHITWDVILNGNILDLTFTNHELYNIHINTVRVNTPSIQ
jgi:hypothetical protein